MRSALFRPFVKLHPFPKRWLRALLFGVVLGASFATAPHGQRARRATLGGPLPTVTTPLEDVSHYLRRITNGPRPVDIENLVPGYPTSLRDYVDQQLDPDAIPDNDPDYLNLLDLVTPDIPGGEEWTIDSVVREHLIRGLYSEKQLQHVMGYFWKRHFSTSYDKAELVLTLLTGSPTQGAADAAYEVWEENVAFRDNALGRFEDLLFASAKGPLMLIYLDGAINDLPPVCNPPSLRANENYARELLELHTLGVDEVTGEPVNYDENDVRELAKIFTGWKIQPDAGGGRWTFLFDPSVHDTCPRSELFSLSGTPLNLTSSGEDEGNDVLSHLASMPETADFVCRKIYTFLVSEKPPPAALIDDCIDLWINPPGGFDVGDIGLVVERMLKSGDMFNERWGKVRMPVATLLSTVRAFDGQIADPAELDTFVEYLEVRLSQLLFRFPSPDGFPSENQKLISTLQVMQRTNLAQIIFNTCGGAAGCPGEVDFDPVAFFMDHGIPPGDEELIVDRFLSLVAPGNLTLEDRDLALEFLATSTDGAPAAPLASVVGTPEWRERVLHFFTYVASLPQALFK